MINENFQQRLKELLLSARSLIDSLLSYLNPPIESAQELIDKLPDDLKALCIIEETDQAFVIRPRQFLGTENFSKILSLVREHGGQYISHGKNSHFEIPRRKA